MGSLSYSWDLLWLKYLLSKGISKEQALEKAKQPIPKEPKEETSSKGSKRVRSEGDTRDGYEAKKAKKLEANPSRHFFSQDFAGIRVGIMPNDFP